MLAAKFIIEEKIENIKVDAADVVDNIAYVVTQYNYKIDKDSDTEISFSPYGPMPASRNDAAFYMINGSFSVIQDQRDLFISLKYSVSYLFELLMIGIYTAFALYSYEYAILLFDFLIVFNFLYRLFKIKKQAKEMLKDLAFILT